MPQIHIIAVGRLREAHWKNAAEAYTRRLGRSYELAWTIIKDGDAALPPETRALAEGERILQALKASLLPVCLDERGDPLSSEQFAHFLRCSFDAARAPCFIIGGAYGLSDAVRQRAEKSISFGPMTLPHELARVLLLEQLYRADAILHKRPYHHA